MAFDAEDLDAATVMHGLRMARLADQVAPVVMIFGPQGRDRKSAEDRYVEDVARATAIRASYDPEFKCVIERELEAHGYGNAARKSTAPGIIFSQQAPGICAERTITERRIG